MSKYDFNARDGAGVTGLLQPAGRAHAEECRAGPERGPAQRAAASRPEVPPERASGLPAPKLPIRCCQHCSCRDTTAGVTLPQELDVASRIQQVQAAEPSQGLQILSLKLFILNQLFGQTSQAPAASLICRVAEPLLAGERDPAGENCELRIGDDDGTGSKCDMEKPGIRVYAARKRAENGCADLETVLACLYLDRNLISNIPDELSYMKYLEVLSLSRNNAVFPCGFPNKALAGITSKSFLTTSRNMQDLSP
eukprot:755145-Hanusia_phi.AAC.5